MNCGFRVNDIVGTVRVWDSSVSVSPVHCFYAERFQSWMEQISALLQHKNKKKCKAAGPNQRPLFFFFFVVILKRLLTAAMETTNCQTVWPRRRQLIVKANKKLWKLKERHVPIWTNVHTREQNQTRKGLGRKPSQCCDLNSRPKLSSHGPTRKHQTPNKVSSMDIPTRPVCLNLHTRNLRRASREAVERNRFSSIRLVGLCP